MRKVTVEVKGQLVNDIYEILKNTVTLEYVLEIMDLKGNNKKSFCDAVIADVLETSAWEDEGYWSMDDVRLAIGRVLLRVLLKGIEEND